MPADATDEPDDITPQAVPLSYNSPRDGALKATEAAYYKRKTVKRTPEEEEKYKEAQKNKPKPKKKHIKRRRGASAPPPTMHVTPPYKPGGPIPPTVVPNYDTRPDTTPED
jgi:hypothetical protein